MPEPLEIVVYHDVLCSWCFLTFRRLDVVRDEYGDAVHWTYRGFPLRAEDQLPGAKERQAFARHYRRITREPEGQDVIPDLWLGDDPPRSTMPPLLAAEAALLQGERQQREILEAMRHAAFVQGLNVSRRDVIIELAERRRLKMDKFVTALDAPATERRVREEFDEARAHGIRGVPSVIIGGEWLMTGARPLADYRETVARYCAKRGGGAERFLH